MNNRSIEAEVCRLQEEIKRIKEQNQKISFNKSYNHSVYSQSNKESRIVNQSNYKAQYRHKKDLKKNLFTYLSYHPSSTNIDYTSRGEQNFTHATKKCINHSEFIRPFIKKGIFSYKKYLDKEDKKRHNKNNLSFLSQDLNLELIHDQDNDNNNDLNSQFNTFFPKDSTGSINLDKYKIVSMTNIATANSTNNNYTNSNNNNNYLYRNSSTPESHQYKQQMNNSNILMNQLMNNTFASNPNNLNPSANINNVIAQFKNEQKDLRNYNDSNIDISSPILKRPSSKAINTQCDNDNGNGTWINKINCEYSPIINPMDTSNHIMKSPKLLIFNPLGSQFTENQFENKNESTAMYYFKNKPSNKRESRRMIIEYIKLIKQPNENIPNLLSNIGISSIVFDQKEKRKSSKKITSNIESPLIIGAKYKHPHNKNTSIDTSILNGISSLFSEPKEKINMINFMSIPRLLNLIINEETLVPCIFILTPSELTITNGIEVYLLKYKEIQNDSFNCIEGYFDLSTLISCSSSSISSQRILLCFYNDDDSKQINKYEIETPSIELRTYYLKGFNYILSKKKNRLNIIK